MFKNKILIIIFCTVFIDLLGIGILIPVIPLLFASPTSEFFLLGAGTSAATGLLLLGFLVAVYPLGQFFATPILGQLSDRYGRKKILAISLFGTALSYVLFAYAIITKNIPLLFASRFFDGLTGGNISVAQAMIADTSAPAMRARNFGMLGAAFGLGFIFGPFIGGKLSDPTVVHWFTAATPFFFAAILAFLNMLSVLFLVPETNKHMHNEKIQWRKSLNNIKRAYAMKEVNVIFLTNFLFFAGFTFFTTFFGVFLIKKFNFSQGDIGEFFAYVGIWSVITQALLIRLFSKLNQKKVVAVSLVGSGVLVLAYFLPQYAWQLLLIPPIFSLCNGLTMSHLNSIISHLAPPSRQGEILGINASVSALAQTLPAILSGFIAASLSSNTPIIVSAVIIIISGIVFKKLYKPHQNTTI